jgi:hypothetical protein
MKSQTRLMGLRNMGQGTWGKREQLFHCLVLLAKWHQLSRYSKHIACMGVCWPGGEGTSWGEGLEALDLGGG